MIKNTHVEEDRRTLEAIGRIYCSAHHEGPKDDAGLCPLCRETVESTFERAAACPFGHEANCQDCTVHCQRGEARERIREMMRFAAPRMTFRHPVMTFNYLRKKKAASRG